jgi:23S rRNA (cytidine1920-2'-O)/16S rRNA (cytidine1409-2'-O)-methyltransferase
MGRMARSKRYKLKELLVIRGLAPSEARAEAFVMAGKVRVNGSLARQAGESIFEDALIELETPRHYVGRGAFKLLGALDEWQISPKDLTCADVGSSTGGFTQVLLERGARKVFAIDVGKGELAWSLRSDPRVVVMEETNARYVSALGSPIELATVDVSFISLRVVLPAIKDWFGSDRSTIIALIKPQFEIPAEEVPPGGIIVNPEAHRRVLDEFTARSIPPGLVLAGLMPSPLKGQGGNQEFLCRLEKDVGGVPQASGHPSAGALVADALRRAAGEIP